MTVRTVELTMKKQQLQAHRSPLDAAGRRRRTAVFFLAGLDGIGSPASLDIRIAKEKNQ
jgi:hypothetical protein